MSTNLSHSSANPESKPAKPNSLKTRLFSNIPQKIIALICALILFTIAISDRNMTVDFDKIPITITVPEGYATLDNTDEVTVNITLHGRASMLRGLNRDDLGTIALTAPAREGNVQMTLHPALLSLPDGIRVEKFYPEFVPLNLEPLTRRRVSVSTDHAFTGELLPGHQLGEITLTPDEIEIYGPKSVVSATSQLYIEPIDLTGKAASFKTVRWVILNRTGLRAASDKVEVSIGIVSASQKQVVRSVPLVALNLARPHEFVPKTVDLTLIGDEASLAKIDVSHLSVTIDAAIDSTQPDHTRMLNAASFVIPNLPKGVAIDRSSFPAVLLKVYQSPETDTRETEPESADAPTP